MEEKTKEEVEPLTNPTPEETPAEEAKPQEKIAEKKEVKDEPSEKEKRLYARLMKSEEKLVKQKEETLQARKQADPNDVDKILEIQIATQGLGEQEISELKLRADHLGKSLTEARKDKNFLIWQNAYNQKVEEDNTPSPSTVQDTKQDMEEDKGKSIHSFDTDPKTGKSKGARDALNLMNDDEKEDWLDGLTINGVRLENLMDKDGMPLDKKAITAFKKEKKPKGDVQPLIVNR